MDQAISIGRRRWIQAALAGAVPIPLLVQRALAYGSKPPGIYRIVGSVRINGNPAAVGQLVSPGDVIETGPASEAVLIVGKDAFLVRASSRIATSGRELFVAALRVATGGILSVFSPGARRIETPTATVGIRGTGIYVEIEPGRSYVCTCYGVAEIQATERPELRETVQTTHHEQPRYIYADRTMPVEEMLGKAPVVNHTDDELVMLESLVGRRPPFVYTTGSATYSKESGR